MSSRAHAASVDRTQREPPRPPGERRTSEIARTSRCVSSSSSARRSGTESSPRANLARSDEAMRRSPCSEEVQRSTCSVRDARSLVGSSPTSMPSSGAIRRPTLRLVSAQSASAWAASRTVAMRVSIGISFVGDGRFVGPAPSTLGSTILGAAPGTKLRVLPLLGPPVPNRGTARRRSWVSFEIECSSICSCAAWRRRTACTRGPPGFRASICSAARPWPEAARRSASSPTRFRATVVAAGGGHRGSGRAWRRRRRGRHAAPQRRLPRDVLHRRGGLAMALAGRRRCRGARCRSRPAAVLRRQALRRPVLADDGAAARPCTPSFAKAARIPTRACAPIASEAQTESAQRPNQRARVSHNCGSTSFSALGVTDSQHAGSRIATASSCSGGQALQPATKVQFSFSISIR